MIETHLPPFTTQLDDGQTRQLLDEGYATFGCCLTEDELRRARHAYERSYEAWWETGNATEAGIEYPLGFEWYYTEPDLIRLMANPTILCIARAALQTDDIEFSGGILRRTRFRGAEHVMSGAGWHPDLFLQGDPAEVKDDRVAIWYYFSDTTRDEGATQVIPGSAVACKRSYEETGAGATYLHDDLVAADGEYEAGRGHYIAAPAGGGMAFKSYAFHRARPNLSGNCRRIMTMDFRVRGTPYVADGNYAKIAPEHKEALLAAIPEEHRGIFM